MFWTIFWILNGLAALFTWWYVAGVVAWGSKYIHDATPEGADWVGGAFVGLLGALIWPISLVVAFTYESGKSANRKLQPPRFLYTPKRYEDKLKDARIENLEKQLRETERAQRLEERLDIARRGKMY